MANQLTSVKVTRVLNSVVAGTSGQASSAVDMEGFEGVLFILSVGALSSSQVTSLKAQQSADSGGTPDTFADMAGTLTGPFADTDGNKQLILDVYRPQERYVKAYVNRATGNAVIDSVVAIQYGPRKRPTVQGSSVKASKVVVSPDEGTA